MKQRARNAICASVDTECGTIRFEYERGAVKNVNLRVRSDGSVHVSAPSRTSFSFVEKFVCDHAKWITERVRRAEERRQEGIGMVAAKGYLPFLGEPLAVIPVQGDRSRAFYDEKKRALVVVVADVNDGEAVSSAAEKWAEKHAREVLAEIFREAETETRGRFGTPVEPNFRKMRARWGSCNVSKRKITLNTALVYAPRECVRYVCMHELCHLLHPNHDQGFYRELAAVCPEWKKLRRRLNAETSAMLAR